jgi:hypothetical protein
MDLLDRVGQKTHKQELAGSNGAVPASKTEAGDPVVGLAVRIVKGIWAAIVGSCLYWHLADIDTSSMSGFWPLSDIPSSMLKNL